MLKPKLIFRSQDNTGFGQGWIMPIVQDHFDLTEYDPAATYSTQDAVLTVYQTEFEPDPWWKPLEESGHKIILDHLWDSDVDTPSLVVNNRLVLRNPNWLWYRECLHYTSGGYNLYQPQKDVQYSFLMLMNKQREHRDRMLVELDPLLHKSLYSYVDRGIRIPGDQDGLGPDQMYWLYYMNPDWYNSTAFSVVVESWMRTMPWVRNPEVPNYRTEVSEKIFKPLAYFHPFVCVGSEGTCRYLQREGFETFDNLWSESYDTVLDDSERFTAAIETIYTADRDYASGNFDSLTWDKMRHNNARFFQRDLVVERFTSEIIQDIFNFI